ncbi:helix-turn-helix domain-containing protein [Staphylococcus chromogenes]|uniref:helix-turn-helix domain-containing protein n=1 Tax=Staphylococcus chromogenes TaxID=46126 RepID=UPI001F457472|nr:helix-turn-helix transcriptional regulator [Staphylococcus chromogenes]
MYKKKIGKKINRIRVNMGLSMNEFGERIDKASPVKSGVISNWENGIQLPNKKRLKRIADLGGISVEKLLNAQLVSYTDLEKNIKSKDIEILIKENLMHLFQSELPLLNSRYNVKFHKVLTLIDLLLNEETLNLEELIEKMYKSISENNFDFYTDTLFVLINEDHNDLSVKIYITDFLYAILLQISLEYPNVYYKNLQLQIDNFKKEIENISKKGYIFKDYKQDIYLPKFINERNYEELLNEVKGLKDSENIKCIIDKN